jgi:2,3-bisphosphoglycerate-independent phosphoglycerate mutase
MVGHTGDLAATISCCTLVDRLVGELLQTCREVNGRFLVTSDHGNADDMVQRAKKTLAPLRDTAGRTVPLTSHTLAPVPVAVGGAGIEGVVALREDLPAAGLANVAATVFELMGFAAPAHMQPSLLASA